MLRCSFLPVAFLAHAARRKGGTDSTVGSQWSSVCSGENCTCKNLQEKHIGRQQGRQAGRLTVLQSSRQVVHSSSPTGLCAGTIRRKRMRRQFSMLSTKSRRLRRKRFRPRSEQQGSSQAHRFHLSSWKRCLLTVRVATVQTLGRSHQQKNNTLFYQHI